MTPRKAIIGIGAFVLLIAGVGITLAARPSQLRADSDNIPVALVKRGNLDLRVYTTGELKTQNSIIVSAPPVAGAALQITRLLHAGAPVKKGDVIIEFDPSEQRYKLEQSHSELQQAEQDIIKAKADAAVQAAQDKVALLKARYDVRQAQLEVQKNELVSVIDAKKNQLALEEANRALAELQQDISSHATTGRAGLELAQEKWNKAKLSMDLAQQNIQKMHVTSPATGLIALEKNQGAMGGFFFTGMTIPDFHEGDHVQPGSAIAQIIVSTEMELSAKVNELERANITPGEPAEIEFDALPGKIFHGKIKSAAGMVQHPFWEVESSGKFDVSIQLTDTDPRLRPGLTAQVVILGASKPNTLYVPRLALFQKDGKPTLYRKTASGFAQLQARVGAENESRAEINGGLKEGDAVALVDPTAPRKTSPSAGAEPLGGTP